MAEEYIGSQQHFEDCINEHYDQKERYEKEINAQMEKDYYKDMEKQYYDDMEKQHYEQLISDSAEKPNYNLFCKSKNCPHYIEWQCYGVLVSCKLVGESTNIETYPDDCPFVDEIKLVSF